MDFDDVFLTQKLYFILFFFKINSKSSLFQLQMETKVVKIKPI